MPFALCSLIASAAAARMASRLARKRLVPLASPAVSGPTFSGAVIAAQLRRFVAVPKHFLNFPYCEYALVWPFTEYAVRFSSESKKQERNAVDFTLSTRETMFRDQVRAFVDAEIRPRDAEYRR